MSRSDVIEAMAHELGGQVGAPSCPGAAADLAKLYEASNGMPLLELAHQAPPVDGMPPGAVLAMLAMGELEVGAVPFRVPSFQIERRGREIVWEGADAVSNPAKPSLRFMVIAPTAARQRAMTRTIKKAYPRAIVTVSDNAGAAMANIEVHDPDVVVTEYHLLGGTTGDDVLGWVQENRPSLADRFVFMTDDKLGKIGRHVRADANEDELRRSLRAGAPAAAPPPPVPSSRPRPVPAPPTVGTLVVPATPRRTQPARGPAAAEPDDATFDQMVLDAVPRVPPDGWFGRDKIFLSALWDVVKTDPRAGSLTLERFKQRMVVAQQQSRFLLARADIVGAMDPRMVRDSEHASAAGSLHFLLAPGSPAYQDLHGHRPAGRPASIAWTTQASPPAGAAFADLVKETAQAIGPEVDNKVILTSIWNVLKADPRMRGMGVADFKRQLLLANANGELQLSADGIRPEDLPRMVASPVTGYTPEGNAIAFHTLVLPGTGSERRPPAAVFAETVRQAMRGIHGSGPGGPRFGARKVFISALWNRLRDTPKLGDMTFDEFGRRLIEAHQAGDLVLARADFVAAMDPSVVRASEITMPGGGARWHFVVDPDATGF